MGRIISLYAETASGHSELEIDNGAFLLIANDLNQILEQIDQSLDESNQL